MRAALRPADTRYRWWLGRRWADGPPLVVVALNPSVADGRRDDPTTRACCAIAAIGGFGALWLVNLYAWRDTSPAALRRAHDPIGVGHDQWLRRVIVGRDVLAAWGVYADPRRAAQVRALPARWWVLGWTKGGAPRHPLYVRRDTPWVRWEDDDALGVPVDPRGL